ncbi:major facilitator superfamily domain-containing protein [Xylariales sp. PMI_506]|nr:major facilitator superfamily domain-containing protein [Xylariales sp. PMI_506]
MQATTDASQPSSFEEKDGTVTQPHSTGDEATVESLHQEPSDSITGFKLVFVLASLALACFLVLLDTSIVSTAVPKITDDFHSLPDVGWYASAYQLGSSALQPLTGKIYRYFNLKWSFIGFFAIFEIGSAICGASQSSNMLIVGRAVAGIGASGLMNGAIAIVTSSVQIEKRPMAQLGVICGPLVGGAFTSDYTWRWCFYINLPLGAIVVIPLMLVRIPDQMEKPSPGLVLRSLHKYVDLLGFGLLASAIVQLLLALEFGGNQFTWNSSQVIGLFVGAGATFITWSIWNYYQGEEGLLPFSIILRRTVFMSGMNYTFLVSAMLGASYFLPVYFQAVKGVSPITSGVYLLPTILPQLLTAILSGPIVSRIGYTPPLALFAATLSSIGSGLYSLFQPNTSTGEWVGFQVLTGFGRGAGFQMPLVATQHAVSPAELDTAMAFIVWCQYIGPTIFLTLYNTVFDISLRSQLPEQAPGANAESIIAAGATGFRELVSPQELPGVLVAYANSLDRVFYLIAAVAALSWISAWGMGWNDIRQITASKRDQAKDPNSKMEEGGFSTT